MTRTDQDSKRASPGPTEGHFQPDAPVAFITSDISLDSATDASRAALELASDAESVVLTLD